MAQPRSAPFSKSPPARPAALEVERLSIGGLELLVVSHALPAGAPADPLATLSPALREVARLAVQGLDNAAIARARGTSQRTVAKQLECVYERLGIDSRVELAALLARSRDSR